MHGKTILGTKEAFAGFELDFDEVGAFCENISAVRVGNKYGFIKVFGLIEKICSRKFNQSIYSKK